MDAIYQSKDNTVKEDKDIMSFDNVLALLSDIKVKTKKKDQIENLFKKHILILLPDLLQCLLSMYKF